MKIRCIFTTGEEMHYDTLTKEAYRLFFYDSLKDYPDLYPMKIWGFDNLINDDLRQQYIEKAVQVIRRKKLEKVHSRL